MYISAHERRLWVVCEVWCIRGKGELAFDLDCLSCTWKWKLDGNLHAVINRMVVVESTEETARIEILGNQNPGLQVVCREVGTIISRSNAM